MLKEGTFLRNVLKNIIIALLLSALPTGLLLHQDFKQQHAAAPAVQTTKIVSAKTTAKQTTTVTTHKTAPETTRRSASSPYASIAVSQKDVDVLERLVYFESRGEHGEAVVEIVLNRVLSPSFPNTIGSGWSRARSPIAETTWHGCSAPTTIRCCPDTTYISIIRGPNPPIIDG